MFLAQAAGEYGAVAGLVRLVESGLYWAQTSLSEDRPAWILGAVVLALCLWLFRRR